MKLTKLLLIASLSAVAAFAQSITPNTTLCGAVTATATQVCLTATSGSSPLWSVTNQTGIYVDNEYMLVQLTNNQTITGSNQLVPVSRGNRSGLGAPAAHANGAVAWIATTALTGNAPGENGFVYGTQSGDSGACTRASLAFVPHIWVDKGVKRDCIANPSTSAAVGNWANYNDYGDPFATGPLQILSASGAISVTSGHYVITKAGVAAMTLAAPTAGIQDGTVVYLQSSTAYAHTLTATGLLQTGSASVNVATFAAQAGAGLVLMAYNGKWIVLSEIGVTFS